MQKKYLFLAIALVTGVLAFTSCNKKDNNDPESSSLIKGIKFCCDLDRCRGCCCIEGDAGAPLTEEEERKIQEILPILLPDMTKEAKAVVEQQGIAYNDPSGERVTSIRWKGEELPPDLSLTMCLNSYRASGAGGYEFYAECETLREQPEEIAELIISYIDRHPQITVDETKWLTVLY